MPSFLQYPVGTCDTCDSCGLLIGRHEEQVLNFVLDIETRFLAAVQAEYGHDRGWRVCGASSIALAWLIELYTGVPLRQTGLDGHIKLLVRVYPDQPMDHVILVYYTGFGDVFCIDITGKLYWHGWDQLKDAIEISCFDLLELPVELAEQFRLFPFEANWANQIGLHNILRGNRTPSRHEDYTDLLAALHSPDALTSQVRLPSGRIINCGGFWGSRIVRVIRTTMRSCPEFSLHSGASSNLGWLLDLVEAAH